MKRSLASAEGGGGTVDDSVFGPATAAVNPGSQAVSAAASPVGRAGDNRASRLTRVGLYELSPGLLGKGNFAVVRLGTHRLTKTKVAVKIVDKRELEAENLGKISREIKVMQHLTHPNIIRLYQVMESDSMIYIVTEYAAKGDIFDYLVSHGRLAEPQARHFFVQILSAVKYCHSQGVVHRDLKAENLLLDSEGSIKLADFGFSNYFEEESLLSTFCGSPPYAAPELFEGKQYVGSKVDIWSLGVVLYVLVSGTLPFDGSTLSELRDRVLKCQYRVPYFLSTECESLLKGQLVVQPEKRLTLEGIARHPWTDKGRTENILTARLIDDVLSSEPLPSPVINETVIDCIVGTVGADQLTREDVAESVQLNKCDDLCAVYHLIAQNKREQEREIEKAANLSVQMALMGGCGAAAVGVPPPPPLSPTSMSPFFASSAGGAEAVSPTEIFDDIASLVEGGASSGLGGGQEDSKAGPGRRHTLGPAAAMVRPSAATLAPSGPVPLRPLIPPFLPHLPPIDYRAILPQINLTQNLPLVSNLPPESFSTKNPHLLRPPAVMGAAAPFGGTPSGRRASDGGAYLAPTAAAILANMAAAAAAATSDEVNGDVNFADVLASSTATDSPRRRRTGLHTVMEKPPEINPALIHEVEARMTCGGLQAPPPASGGGGTSGASPMTSPSKPGLRQRRTGLSTVMEVGKGNNNLALPTSPSRRLSSDGAGTTFSQYRTQTSVPSSNDVSPSSTDVRALQEEVQRLQSETQTNSGSSLESGGSSGYMSPHCLLRPPLSPSNSHSTPRRSSDSCVTKPADAMQQLYDEMYNTSSGCPSFSRMSSPAAVALNVVAAANSRRYSYPNSPVHAALAAAAAAAGTSSPPPPQTQQGPTPPPSRPASGLTTEMGELRLHAGGGKERPERNATPPGTTGSQAAKNKWKGSITQGVPSRTCSTLRTPGGSMAHSHSFDDAFDKRAGGGGGTVHHLLNRRHTHHSGGGGGGGSRHHHHHPPPTVNPGGGAPRAALTAVQSMDEGDGDQGTSGAADDDGQPASLPPLLGSTLNPEICVTTEGGDEVKLLLGAPKNTDEEPMDHS